MWELVPELDPILPEFTDLLFLGSRGLTISEIQPRNNTGTIALEFIGDTDSVVTLPSENHPTIITNELTIRSVSHVFQVKYLLLFLTQSVGSSDRGHYWRCSGGKDHRQWFNHILCPGIAA